MEEPVAEAMAEAIYDATQASAVEDEYLNGSVLLGVYVIAEWAGQDDAVFLSQHSRGADGTPLANWRSLGYLEWARESNKPMPSWMRDDEDEDE